MPIGVRSERIGFERVRRGDLAMLHGWRGEPHVREWWGPPEDQVALVEADLDGGGLDTWIASLDGVPFAYIQDGDSAEAYEPYFADPLPGARAVDLLIGPPDHLGRDLAAPLLRAFGQSAAARGAKGLLVDPDARNARALAAYVRAGFVELLRHRDGAFETVVLHLPIPRETSA